MSYLDEFPLLIPVHPSAHSSQYQIVARTSSTHPHLNVVDEWHGFIQVASREFPLFIQVMSAEKDQPAAANSAAANMQDNAASMTTNTSSSKPLPISTPLRTLMLSKPSVSSSSLSSVSLLVKSDESLRACLKGYESVLSQCWEQTQSVEQLLIELREIATRVLRNQSSNPSSTGPSSKSAPNFHPLASVSSASTPNSSSYLLRVLAEIKLLPQGFDSIESGDPNEARELTLKYIDGAKRKHLLQIKLPENYPKSMALTVAAELPIEFDSTLPSSLVSSSVSTSPDRLTASTSPLRFLYDRFMAVIDSLQLFWHMLDDLCMHAWVLEPAKPLPRSTRELRVALGKSCWLEVNIDPRSPFAVPALLRVFGNEAVAAPLQSKMQLALETNQWGKAPQDIDFNSEDVLMTNAEENAPSDIPLDENARHSYVRRNLLHVLGMSSLPLPTETNRQEFNLECPICTSYHLEDAVPDIVCSNAKCESSYHRDCLVQWFESDPTTQNIFGALHGACVICSNKMVVRL